MILYLLTFFKENVCDFHTLRLQVSFLLTNLSMNQLKLTRFYIHIFTVFYLVNLNFVLFLSEIDGHFFELSPLCSIGGRNWQYFNQFNGLIIFLYALFCENDDGIYFKDFSKYNWIHFQGFPNLDLFMSDLYKFLDLIMSDLSKFKMYKFHVSFIWKNLVCTRLAYHKPTLNIS